jgi:hypothetical protein
MIVTASCTNSFSDKDAEKKLQAYVKQHGYVDKFGESHKDENIEYDYIRTETKLIDSTKNNPEISGYYYAVFVPDHMLTSFTQFYVSKDTVYELLSSQWVSPVDMTQPKRDVIIH